MELQEDRIHHPFAEARDQIAHLGEVYRCRRLCVDQVQRNHMVGQAFHAWRLVSEEDPSISPGERAHTELVRITVERRIVEKHLVREAPHPKGRCPACRSSNTSEWPVLVHLNLVEIEVASKPLFDI